ISARQLVTLLDACVGRGDEGAAALMQSLALAGETGTLEDRMGGTGAAGMVRAKSGFINGTSALSGVAMTESERFLLFSILVNYKPKAGLNRAVWKPMQDSICEAIVHGP
ncbi:MAG: D-alanyl-D-alanine carboxypeptidase, partial [Planctomycetes bacterium]|nr:D-alanyl-D-alanine carboxypeptidase [Planctomycetota bacterium]